MHQKRQFKVACIGLMKIDGGDGNIYHGEAMAALKKHLSLNPVSIMSVTKFMKTCASGTCHRQDTRLESVEVSSCSRLEKELKTDTTGRRTRF